MPAEAPFWPTAETLAAPPTLYPFQAEAVEKVRSAVRRLPGGKRRVILQSETGSGKTVMVSYIIARAVETEHSALFLAHTRELIRQVSEKLASYGVRHGVIMAGRPYEPRFPVQVASKDTLLSRALRRETVALPEADVVVVDECHRSMSHGWQRLLGVYARRAVLLGLSATPAAPDGYGLWPFWRDMVSAARTSELVAGGYLTPTRVFAPHTPDLRRVRVHDGDYDRTAAASCMDKPGLVGDVVEWWRRLAVGRPTLCFAASVAHSLHLRDRFMEAGVRAVHVDGNTDPEARDAMVQEFLRGRVEILCNCDVFTEGTDLPLASCAILAKPTKKYRRYKQIAGRIQRPYRGLPTKRDALLIDHAGLVFEHGFPDEDFAWALNPEQTAEEQRDAALNPPGEPPRMKVCPACYQMFSGQTKCPYCGTVLQTQAERLNFRQGVLVEIDRDKMALAKEGATPEARQKYWLQCLGVQFHRGAPATAAAMMFKARFGGWPKDVAPMPAEDQWKTPVNRLWPDFGRKKASAGADAPAGLFD